MKNNTIKIVSAVLLVAMSFSFIINVFASTNPQPTGTQKTEALQTEKNQDRLSKAVPPPELQDSIERRNLVNRLQRNNKAEKIGYVFLLSDNGAVITNYTIKGKVSSLNSLLTTSQQLVGAFGEQCGTRKKYPDGGEALPTTDCYSVDSPDFDGSYGKNPEGVFFFTADGNMIEWTGKYLYSEQPMTLSTAPVLTYSLTK